MSRKWTLPALAVVAVALTVGLTACGGGSGGNSTSGSGGGTSESVNAEGGGEAETANATDSEGSGKVAGKTIGIVDCCRSNEGARRIEEGIADASEAAGWKVEAIDGEANPNKWGSAMVNLVNKGVDAIFLDAINAPEAAQGVEAAEKADIPVVGVVVPAFPEYTFYTSIDMTAVGASQTQYMVDKLGPKGGEVALLEYCVGISKLKCLGREAVLKENPQVKVAAKVYQETSEIGIARKSMSEVLQAHPDIKAVWAFADPTAVGAVQAIEAAGKGEDVWVVSENGDADALELIREGSPLVMTVGSPLEQAGWSAVDQLMRYFSGEPYQSTQVPFADLTKENVDRYAKPGQPFRGTEDYEALYKKSWQEKYGI